MRPVRSASSIHENPIAVCAPVINPTSARSVSPTQFKTGNPACTIQLPIIPPAPAGKPSDDAMCRRANTAPHRMPISQPAARNDVTGHSHATSFNVRSPPTTSATGMAYAITPNNDSMTSAIHAPLRPTQLLTARLVPRSVHAGSIGEYDTSASSVYNANATSAIKPTSLRGAPEDIDRTVLTMGTCMRWDRVYIH